MVRYRVEKLTGYHLRAQWAVIRFGNQQAPKYWYYPTWRQAIDYAMKEAYGDSIISG